MKRHGPSGQNARHGRHVPPPSTCLTGKVQYRKKRQAKLQADRASRQADPRRRPNLRPYECFHCGLWHLSSQPASSPHLQPDAR